MPPREAGKATNIVWHSSLDHRARVRGSATGAHRSGDPLAHGPLRAAVKSTLANALNANFQPAAWPPMCSMVQRLATGLWPGPGFLRRPIGKMNMSPHRRSGQIVSRCGLIVLTRLRVALSALIATRPLPWVEKADFIENFIAAVRISILRKPRPQGPSMPGRAGQIKTSRAFQPLRKPLKPRTAGGHRRSEPGGIRFCQGIAYLEKEAIN